ncbi:isochorismatase family protein [Sphingomonas sp.]|uniref:isochorismatase family protein n=1 Tax=Sphingomonas sp. TaxID=28214 RepID=UPI00286CA5EC|nr:isochorismatase family protein [Sphingomonas sp.]
MTTPLDEDYAKAGFDGHLPFGQRPAVLIVDVCRAYLDPASPLYAGVESALAANITLAAAARAAHVPVVFTRVRYGVGGLDGGLFTRKVPALAAFLDNNPLGDFDDALRPHDADLVVTKQYASAFFATSLAASLTAMGIDSLLITGFSTSGCVRATALDALQHGFIPYVVRDACGDRAPGPHDSNLFDLQAKYAEVVGLDEALDLLKRSALPQSVA